MLIFVLCALPGFAQKKTYTVQGKISGLTTGKVYLVSDANAEEIADSAIIRNGSFVLKGTIAEPMFYMLRIAEVQRAQMAFFLEPGIITIKTHKDTLYKGIVTGSKANGEWKEWLTAWNKISMQAGPMYQRLDSVTQGGTTTASEKERQIFEDGMASLNKQTGEAVTAFVKKYPQSPVGPFIIFDRFINYPDTAMAASTFKLLGAKAKNSFYGKKITEHQRVALKTGIGASPEFAITDTAGKIINLSDLRGQYVLVDFWASWCVPCRKENPNVVNAFLKYHSRGFEIIGVSLDTDKKAWLKAIEKDELKWYHLSDLKGWEAPIVKMYGITGIPTNFLVDPSGKIIAKDLREENLLKKLQEVFPDFQ